MKALKKPVVWLIGLVLMVGMILQFPLIAKAETYGDFLYRVRDDGTVLIGEYSGTETDLVIPSEIEGHTVTSIAELTFYNCVNLDNITIPEGVTNIGNNAFIGCSGLKRISLPESVIIIGNYVFSGCSGLTDIYYNGSESDKNKIEIGLGNNELLNANWHYNYKPEPTVPTENGLYNIDGTWKYYENGVLAKKTGMVQRPDTKKWFYVENGVYNNKATGVVQRVENKKYYYVKNGKYDNTFTGVATGVTDKKTYYITKGQLKAVTGVFADGKKWKYFVNGKFSASTGVVARSADKKWVYISKGIVAASTGMAKRLTDNKWLYVEKGVLAKKTGLVQRISDKKWFYVQNGVYNNKYTGGAKKISDSKWIYVEKGQPKNATGLAKCTDKKYRYFKSGMFFKYTGKAKLIGGGSKQYNVKNGVKQ